jgi:maleate isomerase
VSGVRIGILVVHNDPTPEAEMWRSVGPDLTVHTARFDTPRPFGTEFTGLDLDDLFVGSGVERAARHLGDLGVDALGYCFTSSSAFGGPAFDTAFAERAGPLVEGVPVVTAGRAIREALARTPPGITAMVVPPWFGDATVDAVCAYLAVPVRDVLRFRLPPTWDGIPRPDLFDLGARHAVDQDELERQLSAGLASDVDTVIVPGSGFASLTATRRLHRSRGIRFVSANSALLSALTAAARSDGRDGAGQGGRGITHSQSR